MIAILLVSPPPENTNPAISGVCVGSPKGHGSLVRTVAAAMAQLLKKASYVHPEYAALLSPKGPSAQIQGIYPKP